MSNDSFRTHELALGDLTLTDDAGDACGPLTLTVTLCQRETIIEAGTGGVRRGEPFLFMDGLEAQLSSDEGRQLGEMLIAAADQLDRIAAEAAR